MTQAKDDRRKDIGEPQGTRRWLAARHMPGKTNEPGQEREQEQAAQQLLSDAAVEARQEAFPQGRDWKRGAHDLRQARPEHRDLQE